MHDAGIPAGWRYRIGCPFWRPPSVPGRGPVRPRHSRSAHRNPAMTSQTTIGDLLDAALSHLAAAARPGHASPGGEDLLAASQSTRRLVQILRRYVLDITTGFGTGPAGQPD